MHGAGRQGCLCLGGKYISFPDIEDAKNLMKYFRANGWTASMSMERDIPEEVYICLNGDEQQRGDGPRYRLASV